MGQQCSIPDETDNFQGSNITVAAHQEQFIQGRLPLVNQNPKTFNDDDPIDVMRGRGNSRYGQNQIDLLQHIQYNLKENLSIDIKSHGLKQQSSEEQLALMVSLVTKEMQLQDQKGIISQRPGIDLICVIDHSGSMQGEKIKLVKRTLKHMLEFLQDNDRLCLIQFDCRCYRLCRLMQCTQDNKKKFRIAIHAIQARGGTNIENGMHMAFSVIKHRKYKNPVCAIFLLSDGVDEGAEERVGDSLQRCQIRDPFTIKTFGFGRDVCPKLMSEIAHFKEGQFYFVPDISVIDECFVEALGGLVSVVANNVKITIHPKNSSKSKITKAFGDKWQYDSWNNVYSLYQPHLLSGVSKDFIFEMAIPKNQSTSVQVVVKVEAEPIDSKDKVILEQTVVINRVDDQFQNEVMANYMRVKGAETFNNAIQHAENGNYKQSQQMLQNQLNQLLQQGVQPNDPQILMIKNDLELAKLYCNPQYKIFQIHQSLQLTGQTLHDKSRGVQMYDNEQTPIDCAYQNNIQKAYIDRTREFKQINPNYDYPEM